MFMNIVFGANIAAVNEAVARATHEILKQDIYILAKDCNCYSAYQLNTMQLHSASLTPGHFMAVGTKAMLGFFIMEDLEFIPDDFFRCVKWAPKLFENVVNVQELRRESKNVGLSKERFEEILDCCKFEYPEYRITLIPGLEDE